MAYIEFKPVLKKVNLKPDGKKEIVLEVTDSSLQGKLDSLSEMIDAKVFVSLESMQVNFNVTINAKTNEPVTQYEVDEKGNVQEVKSTFEQIEADLDMPEEKMQTREEKEQADREVIDAFIISGLAPNFEGMPNKLPDMVKRRLEGESYLKLANELNMSSGQIVEVIDEYRKRVAPLAIKWQEWKEQQPETKEEPKSGEKPEETAETEEGAISKPLQPSEEFEITDEDKSFEEEQE
ncbi:2-methylcitrate dehydratase [Bacillus cereus]|uniref:2-methylcitrate dehydratase n=2 Tax=Bacillus cereus TaxID=1396 RepID=A0AAW5L823_BACCE|nr:2-methylcitrate dehydratase [Bacillus cereus]MCQ6288784.1 2-methylcitrate dehydratase [Bacillus cereus]MCQ6316617.1 2-methylcitrate dehydratase [Bacillus cereus]MCQ6330394.1 2-methylcitrate dehydratase [Bacillus cereus]MCQ6384990.1 2-methylcitrate dehydratase [Bacillus cereus]